MAKGAQDSKIISLKERRREHQLREAELERLAKIEHGEAVVSTTVLADSDGVHLAFSRPISGLHLQRQEAEQLALWLLASLEEAEQHGGEHG